ncbi:MAG: Mpo1-like protein [Dongiaceae bacterium]
MRPGKFRSFEEFWPYYVGEHRQAATRHLHFAGTTAAIVIAVAAALSLNVWLLAPALIAAYGLAWTGHFFIENNKPATFRHPFWSLRGDLRMYGLMWRGRMEDEVRRLAAD